MAPNDFNHLLSSIKGLSPDQVRQLRRQLDRQAAEPKGPARPATAKPGKTAQRPKPGPARKKPMTRDEFNQHLLSIGLITHLPNPALDIDDDDPADQPIVIEGEPLSETIIRERR